MEDEITPSAPEKTRRGFLASVGSLAMALGLLGGYGTFAAILARFVYPTRSRNRAWLFVGTVDSFPPGHAVDFVTPSGAAVVVARQGAGVATADFLALSSVCPHLGCRVHWEGPAERFFCPCHNGAFDRAGNPIAGPPLASGQKLPRFPLKIEGNLLFIEAPTAAFARTGERESAASAKGIA